MQLIINFSGVTLDTFCYKSKPNLYHNQEDSSFLALFQRDSIIAAAEERA